MTFIFSSESVGEGHPDKVCDQISDAVLDAALSMDPDSRVAIETFTTTGIVIVGGEMTTHATLDVQDLVRKNCLILVILIRHMVFMLNIVL